MEAMDSHSAGMMVWHLSLRQIELKELTILELRNLIYSSINYDTALFDGCYDTALFDGCYALLL